MVQHCFDSFSMESNEYAFKIVFNQIIAIKIQKNKYENRQKKAECDFSFISLMEFSQNIHRAYIFIVYFNLICHLH